MPFVTAENIKKRYECMPIDHNFEHPYDEID